MLTLLYIHGFLSSPSSTKARQTESWLKKTHPDITYLCPYLSPYPDQTRQQLDQLMAESLSSGQSVGVVGSSLGGFWATYLVETYGVRAVLVNPSVRPYDLVTSLLGQTLTNYYTEDSYQLQQKHADQLRAVDFPNPKKVEHYWLMAQTGDETLDYRQAEAKYGACRSLVEPGGDHSFQGYEEHLTDIASFLFDE